MTVMLATLCLNEMEHLPYLYAQHKDWPRLDSWVFVESADRVYAETNPDMVTAEGLSVDGTSEFLQALAMRDPRVTYIPFGFSRHLAPSQGKCESRQQYLDVAEQVKPEFVIVLDADEYYTHEHQRIFLRKMRGQTKFTAYCTRHRHPWRPPSITHESRFKYEVVGGFWNIPLCRGWRWSAGMRYENNHNTPQDAKGNLLDRYMAKWNRKQAGYPDCIHLAFASNLKSRQAKHRYYQARGEGRTDFRGWYVESRAAFETWQPGDSLPRGAKVIEYSGPVPECFAEQHDGNRLASHVS